MAEEACLCLGKPVRTSNPPKWPRGYKEWTRELVTAAVCITENVSFSEDGPEVLLEQEICPGMQIGACFIIFSYNRTEWFERMENLHNTGETQNWTAQTSLWRSGPVSAPYSTLQASVSSSVKWGPRCITFRYLLTLNTITYIILHSVTHSVKRLCLPCSGTRNDKDG